MVQLLTDPSTQKGRAFGGRGVFAVGVALESRHLRLRLLQVAALLLDPSHRAAPQTHRRPTGGTTRGDQGSAPESPNRREDPAVGAAEPGPAWDQEVGEEKRSKKKKRHPVFGEFGGSPPKKDPVLHQGIGYLHFNQLLEDRGATFLLTSRIPSLHSRRAEEMFNAAVDLSWTAGWALVAPV